ncbi:MAG: hypothetical protein IKO39_03350 [Treponema sp.]|nr:hypothetical protein [Treponema sp.]
MKKTVKAFALASAVAFAMVAMSCGSTKAAPKAEEPAAVEAPAAEEAPAVAEPAAEVEAPAAN